MIRSCVTISLVDQARGGPFVFWDDLRAACREAKAIGFDAVEIFAPSADIIEQLPLEELLAEQRLRLAAVGTGAGWVLHRLSLSSASADERRAAEDFIRRMIDAGARHGAMAIVGSMQGATSTDVDRQTAIAYLGESLARLGAHAAAQGVPLLYEPLNRYETDLVHRLAEADQLLSESGAENVCLLADLFHMNIEEVSISESICQYGSRLGHVHLADSNRRAAGLGHLDYRPIAEALTQISYGGYLSAEVFPLPSSQEAAVQTMRAVKQFFA
jgi:sugar phosphate isomerase/epimerase